MPNNRVRNITQKILSDNWYTLKKITFEYLSDKGIWETQHRESYDRGNGAAVLLYNANTGNIILTKQFRMPTYITGHPTGMSIEVCAGLLDGDEPEQCVIREAEEESGYRVPKVKKIMEMYSTPGAVTESVHLFVGEYDSSMKVSEGGGLEEENENIEVLEVSFEDALTMIENGEINDAKTVILLQYAKINNLLSAK